MTSKQRMLTAIKRKMPDRLPVTTHHIMQYFLDKYMNSISNDEFFDYFGLDPIVWTVPHKPIKSKENFYDPDQDKVGFLESRRIYSENWRIKFSEISDPQYKTFRYNFITPQKTLSMVTQSNEYTTWVSEHLVKDKSDIDIIAEFVTEPLCDVDAVNKTAAEFGERGLVRGHICGFDIYGQPGCWQDACCLYGTEKMIMEAYDDPEWVHAFLKILQKRKITFVKSLKGAKYDILELGGGDASTTVISSSVKLEFNIF